MGRKGKFLPLIAIALLLGLFTAPERPARAQSGWNISVALDGEQHGPFDRDGLIELIRAGRLTRETPVWRPGMDNWTPAGRVALVAILIDEYETPAAPEPPPFPEVWVHVAGARQGPLDEAGLRELGRDGLLTPETLVWFEGMADWKAAKGVELMAPFLALDAARPDLVGALRFRARCRATGHEGLGAADDLIAARRAAVRACVRAGGEEACCAESVTLEK